MGMPLIWAVEDSTPMQQTLRDVFGRLGCDVQVLRSAEEALDKLKTGARPDVLILDFRLPGMSGPQLFRKMGLDEKMRTIPVVPFTSHWDEETPSPLAYEWSNLVRSLSGGKPVQTEVVAKLTDFTLPEMLILSVGNILKSSPAGLPKPYNDAVMDLVNRILSLCESIDD
jgi:CheY-like chemotaxis protein